MQFDVILTIQIYLLILFTENLLIFVLFYLLLSGLATRKLSGFKQAGFFSPGCLKSDAAQLL